jgi:hypothetical protein
MGDRSGEEEGKKSSWHPRAGMASRTDCPLCALALSITTICPGAQLGASSCSTETSKALALVEPSQIIAAPTPARESEAIKVVFLPRLRGMLP